MISAEGWARSDLLGAEDVCLWKSWYDPFQIFLHWSLWQRAWTCIIRLWVWVWTPSATGQEPLGLGFLICKMGTKVPSHRVVRIKSKFNPPTQIKMNEIEHRTSFLGLPMVLRTVWTQSRYAIMFVTDSWQEDLLDTWHSQDSGS